LVKKILSCGAWKRAQEYIPYVFALKSGIQHSYELLLFFFNLLAGRFLTHGFCGKPRVRSGNAAVPVLQDVG
jgi:hypothetical protein